MKRHTPSVPEVVLAGIFGLALLGQLARVATPLGLVSWHEIGFGVFWLSILPGIIKGRRTWLAKLAGHRSLILLTGLFLGWTALTTILNARWLDSTILFTTGFAYLARLGLYLAFGASIWLSIEIRQVRTEWLGRVIRWWLILMALAGIGQYLLFPDARLLKELGWDDHLNRAFGTLLDPGFFGLLMAMGAVYLLPNWQAAKGRGRYLWPALWTIQLIGLVLSFSRASYVAYLAGILILAWVQRSRRWLLFIPMLIMALVLVPKDGGGEGQNLARTNSIAARVEVAEFHTEGLTFPEILFGRGWYYESARQLHQAGVERVSGGQIAIDKTKEIHAQAVDNSYLHVFLSTGIIGSILFLWSLALYIKTIGRSPTLAVLAAALVHSLFSTGLFFPWAMLMIAVISPDPS